MTNGTFKITITGWVNLAAALKTANYGGMSQPGTTTVYNPSATDAVYLHFNNSATANPSVGTDGLPLLKDAPSAAYTFEQGDLGTTWLYAAGSVDVIVAIVGRDNG